MAESRASATAIQKLERFFTGLAPEEKEVISDLVRSAMVHAADPRAGPVSRASGPFVKAITPQSAPEIVQSIGGRFGSTPPPVYKSWGCSPGIGNPADPVTKRG